MWLEPNTEPCLVYHGSTMRNIPEQTNGYLFCVSCEGDTIYFDWHHFLLDGHGVSPLFTSILEQYCNLRYGTAFAVQQIVCDPPYDMDAMLAEHPPVEGGSDAIQRDVVQTYEGTLRRTRVCLSKQEPCGKSTGKQRKAGKRPDGSAVHGHAGVSGQGEDPVFLLLRYPRCGRCAACAVQLRMQL